MQGKILIVDAIATNRIVLKVKLVTAFYNVEQATNLADALVTAQADPPDLIITALSMPGGTAADLLALLRNNPSCGHIPVMAIGTPTTNAERLDTLRAGVREILPRPLDETLLLGHVRSMIRGYTALMDLQMRDEAGQLIGMEEPEAAFTDQGHCMLVSADKSMLHQISTQMRPVTRMRLSAVNARALMSKLRDKKVPDVFVFILPAETSTSMDSLRMLSALRSHAATRHAGILVLQTHSDSALSATSLDMGADDLMCGDFDATELALRLQAVLRRNRAAENMRSTVRTGLQAAVFDPLTGLYNRRYAMPHLSRVADHAEKSRRSFSVLLADLDYFKQVNDRYGHASGDAVLVEVADRLRGCVRNCDMAARIGGEEFLVVMPGTPRFQAQRAALRICQAISGRPFKIPGSRDALEITISIGMSINETGAPNMTTEHMLQSADRALYAAKGRGRNQVTMARPAA